MGATKGGCNWLSSYRIHDNCYAVGPFFVDGVTILKQQIRTLNLLFALAEAGRIRNVLDGTASNETPRDIAVIGGGVAGMTAAAAAVKLGNNVWHFEQRPELCHLQAGCDTRAVAPHIYDWPKAGSESPYAGLPVLNWQAGTAAELARCLIKGYEVVQKEASDQLRLYLGATTFVNNMTVKWDNSLDNERGGRRSFACIIIATGFGIERVPSGFHTSSYWRNDSINQSTPGVTSEKTEQILISGTGDGGLIDLLRAKIRGFNQALIIDDLFLEEPRLDKLRNGLEQIRISESGTPDSTALFDSFRCLQTESDTSADFLKILERLEKRLRKDVSAILNGSDDVFSDVLRIGRASLLNSFLVFLLYELKAFNYVPGELRGTHEKQVVIEYPASERRVTGLSGTASTYQVDQVIIRHGTDREKCLRTLGAIGPGDAVNAILEQQKMHSTLTSQPQWRPGYWSRSTQDVLDEHGKGPKEFLPPPSQALASTFASTLSNILEHEAKASESRTFRLTVHRLLQLRDKYYFQQISPYWGSRREGEPARIIEANVGVVGLACRTGESLVLKKTDQDTWGELWSALSAGPTSHVRTPHANISSMLAFPIFTQRDGDNYVSLVIYADSGVPDFFVSGLPKDCEPSQLLNKVFHAAAGFIESSRVLQERGVLRFATSDFWGIRPRPEEDSKLIKKFEKKGALFKVNASYCQLLCFESLIKRRIPAGFRP